MVLLLLLMLLLRGYGEVEVDVLVDDDDEEVEKEYGDEEDEGRCCECCDLLPRLLVLWELPPLLIPKFALWLLPP